MKEYAICIALTLVSAAALYAQTNGRADQQAQSNWHGQFELSSTTFTDGSTLPLIMVLDPSQCSYVSGGGDESPQLSWKNAPPFTRSFVVTLFDTTAAFTHWGMYNISPKTSELPQDAGVAGSTYGQQVFNDFYYGAEYDGPCPPNNLMPYVHDYVVTVFALDTKLNLISNPPNFPSNGETLYRAMFGHILGSASIEGTFSTNN